MKIKINIAKQALAIFCLGECLPHCQNQVFYGFEIWDNLLEHNLFVR